VRCNWLLTCLATVVFAAPGHAQPAASGITPWYVTDIPDEATALLIKNGDSTEEVYPRSYALIIGEVNYANWEHLTTVPGEVAALTKALERQRFKVEVHFDLDSKAMRSVIDDFMQTRGVEPGSRLFIYISAHGWSRVNAIARPVGYILPIDAPAESAPDTDRASKALPMTLFEAWARAPDPRHMLFVFDSCFSGAFFGFQGIPGTTGASSAPANAKKDWTLDENQQLVPPPPETRGIEASDYIEDPMVRSQGRQFLAAGDSTETVPGRSIIAQLIVGILDDRNTRAQSNADFWTTGEELGPWIRLHASDLARSLYKVQAPPRPVFGRLPNDPFFAQGDIIFARNDLPGSPVVRSEAAAWASALEKAIPVAAVLTRNASSPAEANLVLAAAAKQQNALVSLAEAANPSTVSRLTDADEAEMRRLIDGLLVDDPAQRRQARAELAAWLDKLPPPKQAVTVERLATRLSRKSYRFQLGVSSALARQTDELSLIDPARTLSEFQAALATPSGRDSTLRPALEAAGAKVAHGIAVKF